ncbi:formimidoylglutamate deiminase [uncultured Friedmanniella sp.]|uniref:formimidoylglutamate deiminase n=1 Tax=uncultured Friedmanniella sp. TaxID=335381 RepID=UPI0035CAE49C
MPQAYWVEHAWLPDGCRAGVRLVVANGRFTSVEVGPAEPGDEMLHGVALPGLANGHSHAFHRALRGRTHSGGGSFWTWRDQMYAVARRLDPDRYLALARATFAEMVLAGWTAVGEFHYLHHGPDGRPYADPNAMGAALVQAAAEAGIRLTVLDVCYLSGGLGPDGHLPLDEVQRRFSDGSVDGWAERVADFAPRGDVVVGAAAHSVRAVSPRALTELAAVRTDGPLHVHLSEQLAENAAALACYGATPTRLLADAGLLGPQTTAVHATHPTDGDVTLLGDATVTACFCPTTERDLADGLGPASALARAGSPVSLGSDSHAVVDPFEELRGLELNERLSSGRRGCFTPAELVTAGSANGYASLGRDGDGRLAVGASADFVVVRGDSVRTVGAEPEQIIFAATGADVDRVVVAGETVVRDGRHRLGDPARLLAAALGDLWEERC